MGACWKERGPIRAPSARLQLRDNVITSATPSYTDSTIGDAVDWTDIMSNSLQLALPFRQAVDSRPHTIPRLPDTRSFYSSDTPVNLRQPRRHALNYFINLFSLLDFDFAHLSRELFIRPVDTNSLYLFP